MKISKFDLILNTWIAFFLSVILCFAVPVIASGAVSIGEYFSSFCLSFVLSLAIVLLIPISRLGDKFAEKLGAKPSTTSHQLLATTVSTVIMSIIMNSFMTWWGLHLISDYKLIYWQSWLKTFPWVILIVYIVLNLCLWTGIPFAIRVLHLPSPLQQSNEIDDSLSMDHAENSSK